MSIEGEAERLVAAERGLLDEDALERDRLYARAEVRNAEGAGKRGRLVGLCGSN